MKKIFWALAVLCGIMLTSCSSDKTALNDTDRAVIAQAIENHDNTLIYIWADYCEASKNMLEENIKPYLEGLEENNVGIVIIHYGKEEAVADLKSVNRIVVNVDMSAPLLIKRDANNTMLGLLYLHSAYSSHLCNASDRPSTCRHRGRIGILLW